LGDFGADLTISLSFEISVFSDRFFNQKNLVFNHFFG